MPAELAEIRKDMKALFADRFPLLHFPLPLPTLDYTLWQTALYFKNILVLPSEFFSQWIWLYYLLNCSKRLS